LLVVVASVSPWPGVHVEIVTAAQPAPFVPALYVDPRTQSVHTPSLVVVAGVSPWPAVHESIVTAAHAFPFVPAFHVDLATHVAHDESSADVEPSV